MWFVMPIEHIYRSEPPIACTQIKFVHSCKQTYMYATLRHYRSHHLNIFITPLRSPKSHIRSLPPPIHSSFKLTHRGAINFPALSLVYTTHTSSLIRKPFLRASFFILLRGHCSQGAINFFPRAIISPAAAATAHSFSRIFIAYYVGPPATR